MDVSADFFSVLVGGGVGVVMIPTLLFPCIDSSPIAAAKKASKVLQLASCSSQFLYTDFQNIPCLKMQPRTKNFMYQASLFH
jgi:uncharacterized membrane protein YfcA